MEGLNMKKSIFFFAALAALSSCAKEDPVVENPAEETFSVELFTSAPTEDADTKTTLVDGGKFVHWSKGDAIKVLLFPNRSNGNVITGPSGVFASHFEEASSAEAFFRTDSWSWAGTPHDMMNDQRKNRLAKTGVAVYPSTATAVSNKPTISTGSELNSEISFVLPEAQNAVVGNIESGLNFSYAEVDRDSFINTVDNGSKTELQFKNACALIQLTMPAEMPKVTSIAITSNDKVALTGKGSLNLNYYKDVVEGGVTVTEGAGVVLNSSTGFEAGKTYYAVVWPGTHSALTIEFTAEDGSVATKTTDAVTLTASKVKRYTFSKGLDFIAPVQEFNYIYADGTTGNDVKSNIVGVVIYRGNPKEKFNDPDLPDQYCNGLAISTKNVSTYWGGTSALSNVPASVKMSSYSTAHANGGYTVKKIWNNNGFNSLPMYTNSSTVDISKYNTSGWYLPVNNEWNYILANLSDINALLTAAGADTINMSSSRSSAYWLPLAYSSNAITIYTDYYGTKAAYYYDWQYNTNRNVRPIFAF
jgi:hypothetical protein